MTARGAAVVRQASIAEVLSAVSARAIIHDVEIYSVVFYDLDEHEPDAVPGERGADRFEVATVAGAAALAADIDPGHRVSFLDSTSTPGRRVVFHECTWRGRPVTVYAVEDPVPCGLPVDALAEVTRIAQDVDPAGVFHVAPRRHGPSRFQVASVDVAAEVAGLLGGRLMRVEASTTDAGCDLHVYPVNVCGVLVEIVATRGLVDAALDAVLLADVDPPIPDRAFTDALTALRSP